jgi:hypothetical protein
MVITLASPVQLVLSLTDSPNKSIVNGVFYQEADPGVQL